MFAPQHRPDNGRLPNDLPFRLALDEACGLVRQVYDPEVDRCLREAYHDSSRLSGMMDDAGIGQEYARDFLACIEEGTGRRRFDNLRALDIGCGTGYLLSRLADAGATVVGLEPGGHGQDGGQRFGVPVVRDYFPSPGVTGTFDLVTAFGVLEHVVDPAAFVRDVFAQLAPDGTVVLGVPDCEPYLAHGDISLLFHEHWSYFTTASLGCVLRRALPGVGVTTRVAGFGGALYAVLGRQHPGLCTDEAEAAMTPAGFRQFLDKARSISEGLTRYLQRALVGGRTVGIYVPWRAVNILAGLRPTGLVDSLRFFDDNPLLRGTYYPGFRTPVESGDDLLAHPTDDVLIMSYTFGEAIARRLAGARIESTVTLWRDLCEHP